MDWLLQQLINGLALGSIYALIALGYTMVYGVLRFINFAHADVLMLGAYAAYFLAPAVSNIFPLPSLTGTLIIVLLSAMICAAIGILIEILAYRPLRQRPASSGNRRPQRAPAAAGRRLRLHSECQVMED
jgi:branched-chain amino acid transport system permease protein